MIRKNELPPIEGDRVRLRPLTESDLAMTLAWRNQDHIRKWFFYSDVITPEQHQAWYESYVPKDDDLVFIIEEMMTLRQPVGQLALYNIVWDQKRAEFGRLMIGERAARGLGLAAEATEVLMRFSEIALELREVHLAVYAHNEVAIAVYHKCGFLTQSTRNGIVCMSRPSSRVG